MYRSCTQVVKRLVHIVKQTTTTKNQNNPPKKQQQQHTHTKKPQPNNQTNKNKPKNGVPVSVQKLPPGSKTFSTHCKTNKQEEAKNKNKQKNKKHTKKIEKLAVCRNCPHVVKHSVHVRRIKCWCTGIALWLPDQSVTQ